MKNKALITGINGQCGPILGMELLNNGYEVWGMYRNTSNASRPQINSRINLIEGDLTDQQSIADTLDTVKPTHVFNLGGFSHIGRSFSQPELVLETNGHAVLHMLEYIRKYAPHTRFCQVSSYEVFAANNQMPVDEESPVKPVSPYSISKSLADEFVKLYRRSYNIFAFSIYLGNTESFRRGEQFVTKKIVKWINSFIKTDGNIEPLKLGYLDAKRDWGTPHNYMRALRLSAEYDRPEDFMICSGKVHTVREFCELAVKHGLGAQIKWRNKDVDEVGYMLARPIVQIDPSLYRPADVPILYGNPSKAERLLDWKADTNFDKLVYNMVRSEIKNHDYTAH